MRRIVLTTALVAATAGVLATPVAAAPDPVVCASAQAWLDGEDVVDLTHCQTVVTP